MNNEVKKLFDLYWQADRTAVKSQYEAIFGSTGLDAEVVGKKLSDISQEYEVGTVISLENTFSVDTRIFKDTETYFQEFLNTYSPYLNNLLREAWVAIPSDSRPLALRYFLCGFDEQWGQMHTLDGLIHYFGVEASTHIQHHLAPESNFPISTRLRFDQLALIMAKLGIEIDSSPSEALVWKVSGLSMDLSDFAEQNKLDPWQVWATVYDFGPSYLLPEVDTYPSTPPPKIWITAAGPENFEKVDGHTDDSVEVWSINREARRGDFALMYCLKPRSGIVGIYRCGSDAYEDPFWEPWGKSRWAELRDHLTIPTITLNEMKKDPILKDWGLVKMQFQGMLNHHVPNDIWERIKELVTEKDDEIGKLLADYAKSAKGVRTIRSPKSGITELEFEDQVVLPLLQAMGWSLEKTLRRQYEMRIKIGSGFPLRALADFVGFSDPSESQTILIVENKRQITSDKSLKFAVEQCESYAGKLRCPRFAIAAPQGIWVYDLVFPGQSSLVFALEQDIMSRTTRTLADSLTQLMGFERLARK